MNDYKDILEKLTIRTIEYLSLDLQMEGVEKNYFFQEVTAIKLESMTTLIDLSNSLKATVGMSVSKNIANIMVKNFIYGTVEEEVLNSLAYENVAETLNVTLGNILKDINGREEGFMLDISTPYEPQKNLILKGNQYQKMYLCKIKYEDENILLCLFY